MTDDDIVIEVAKLDGMQEFPAKSNSGQKVLAYTKKQADAFYTMGKGIYELALQKQYLTNRDAIIPVIEKQVGLGNRFEYRFVQCLCETMPGMPTGGSATRSFPEIFSLVVRASARQLCIALLKATGRWRE